jgi:hypothetical protein
MFSLPPSVRLFIAAQLVDGRKGPDSLMTLVRDVLGQDIFDRPLSATPPTRQVLEPADVFLRSPWRSLMKLSSRRSPCTKCGG